MTSSGQSVAADQRDQLMAPTLATAVKRYLKDTPEYARARTEERAQAWLEAEATSLGYALAEVVRARLGEFQ